MDIGSVLTQPQGLIVAFLACIAQDVETRQTEEGTEEALLDEDGKKHQSQRPRSLNDQAEVSSALPLK